MKIENTSSDARLDGLLREWKLEDTLPPRFGDRVWQRLARREKEASSGAWWEWLGWIRQALTRPPVAASYVAILLVAGLAAGYWQARSEEARTEEQLGARYVQMLDPFQATSHTR
jgi:hypothetical protein